jgi:hypothetical protein
MADEMIPGDGEFRDDAVDEPTRSVTAPEPVAATPAPPANVGEEAIDMARELIAQEMADIRSGAWKRALRTLGQSAVAAGATAGFDAYSNGIHDYPSLAKVGASAALTVVISYFWNRLRPAAK